MSNKSRQDDEDQPGRVQRTSLSTLSILSTERRKKKIGEDRKEMLLAWLVSSPVTLFFLSFLPFFFSPLCLCVQDMGFSMIRISNMSSVFFLFLVFNY